MARRSSPLLSRAKRSRAPASDSRTRRPDRHFQLWLSSPNNLVWISGALGLHHHIFIRQMFFYCFVFFPLLKVSPLFGTTFLIPDSFPNFNPSRLFTCPPVTEWSASSPPAESCSRIPVSAEDPGDWGGVQRSSRPSDEEGGDVWPFLLRFKPWPMNQSSWTCMTWWVY